MMAKIIQKEAATLTFAAAVNLISVDEMQERSVEHSLSNTALSPTAPPLRLAPTAVKAKTNRPTTRPRTRGSRSASATTTMAATTTLLPRQHPGQAWCRPCPCSTLRRLAPAQLLASPPAHQAHSAFAPVHMYIVPPSVIQDGLEPKAGIGGGGCACYMTDGGAAYMWTGAKAD